MTSQYEQLLHEELEVEKLFQKVAVKQANNKAVRQELNIMEIPAYNPVYGNLSYFYLYYHGMLRIFRNEVAGNFSEMLNSCHYYYTELENKNYDHKDGKGIFLRAKVSAHLQSVSYTHLTLPTKA